MAVKLALPAQKHDMFKEAEHFWETSAQQTCIFRGLTAKYMMPIMNAPKRPSLQCETKSRVLPCRCPLQHLSPILAKSYARPKAAGFRTLRFLLGPVLPPCLSSSRLLISGRFRDAILSFTKCKPYRSTKQLCVSREPVFLCECQSGTSEFDVRSDFQSPVQAVEFAFDLKRKEGLLATVETDKSGCCLTPLGRLHEDVGVSRKSDPQMSYGEEKGGCSGAEEPCGVLCGKQEYSWLRQCLSFSLDFQWLSSQEACMWLQTSILVPIWCLHDNK